MNVGDTVAAKVVATDNKDGYIELSLKEARQAIIRSEAGNGDQEQTHHPRPSCYGSQQEGGLIIEWQGIGGLPPCVPAQAEHYPRVSDGDKDQDPASMNPQAIGRHEDMPCRAPIGARSRRRASSSSSEKVHRTIKRSPAAASTYQVSDDCRGRSHRHGRFRRLREASRRGLKASSTSARSTGAWWTTRATSLKWATK